MHLSEGTLAHAAAGWALALPPLGWSLAGARLTNEDPARIGVFRLLPAAATEAGGGGTAWRVSR